MAVVIYWYDTICFTIVAASVFISIWVIQQRENTEQCTEKAGLLLSHESGGGLATSGQVYSTHLWTSCWRGLHPLWLMITRIISALILAAILAWDVTRYDKTIFVYYTEWTFSLTIFYFLLATVISCRGLLENSHMPSKNAQRAGFWGYVMQTVYQTCAGGVILTDIVFWLVIVPFLSITHFSLSPLMACIHTVNALFLLLETALNNLSFPWFRLAYFVLWSSGYVIVQWIIQACGFPWWPYPFLELDTHWAPLWYICLAVIHFPCYGIYALIVKLKDSLFTKWFPRAFLGAS